MIVRSAVFLVYALLLTIPALAAPLELSASYTRVEIDGNAMAPALRSDFDLGFDENAGFSAAVAAFLGQRFSSELAVSVIDPDAQFTAFDTPRSLGRIQIMPVQLSLRYHPWSGRRIEPYVGAGGAWVDFDLKDELINEADGVNDLALSSDWTWLAQAGARIAAGERLFAKFDVRYMPIESEFTAVDRLHAPIEFDPLFISIGLGWRLGR
ncbi:MAG: outer membrane beta-barrel protein [Acidobacteria bacterium]|nr:outer membrane beta-barrel protein [Acidobacteriota bacterium]